MRAVQIAKLVLAGTGVALFYLGVRTGQDPLRWSGIGVVVVAFLLRFVKPK